ncbi:MAG TPA: transposase [Candidatus Nanoarchaeia archaeon]|nr:transposase [Candidatus Nanoarchaeia archaeon]
MKTNPTRYSSAVGEVWIMMTLKLRYCHNMFDNRAIREYTDAMLAEAMAFYQIRWKKKSFDNNHVHIILEMGIRSKPQLAKLLKGFIAPRILNEFPWLKNRLFRSKGLFNPATDGRTGDMHFYNNYLDKQKYGLRNQAKLTAYT